MHRQKPLFAPPMKFPTTLLLLAALVLPIGTAGAGLLDREVAFTEADVQAALARSNRHAHNYGGVVSVALAEPPHIALGTPEGRIGIAARVDVALLGGPAVPVNVTGTAGLRYDDQAKAFFLDKPVADSLESQALGRDSEPLARRTVNALITAYFKSKPVYVLRENGSAEELAARWLLRSVRIEPGKVVATLSAF